MHGRVQSRRAEPNRPIEARDMEEITRLVKELRLHTNDFDEQSSTSTLDLTRDDISSWLNIEETQEVQEAMVDDAQDRCFRDCAATATNGDTVGHVASSEDGMSDTENVPLSPLPTAISIQEAFGVIETWAVESGLSEAGLLLRKAKRVFLQARYDRRPPQQCQALITEYLGGCD